VQEGVEECDDGNAVETDACRGTCVAAKCGDGVIQDGAEACDDGNQVDNDDCSNSCKSADCGDGQLQMSEQCDDMNDVNEDACLNTCVNATCGDGIVHAGVEQCDTGGASQLCNGDCTNSACGDGKLNVAAGEACDAGGQNATCDGDCTSVVCGDGLTNPQAGEECDDGNPSGGDGCSAQCKVEVVNACTTGNDPKSGAPWVVCQADANTAWISHNTGGNGGVYHPDKICKDLGYTTFQQYGGTCANVCGYCQGGGCNNPGPKNFDMGGLSCGVDELGQTLCYTVMWTCIK
jgi:cysteine-rich repeat protein